MKKRILIDANFPTETRVAVLDKNNNIEAFEYDNEIKRPIKNNIYLAKVTRVEPSLQAAFIDYGDEKSGFLPFSEIHPDYFNIPVNDRKAHLKSLSEITPPKIDSEDAMEKPSELKSNKILENEEVDIDEIQQLVENKIQPDFDIDADENEIDIVNHKSDSDEEDYKIQEVIKKGQILLVQATKEERGNKGASLTTYISLAGKYCVLMPNKPSQNGISRKIANSDERRRLKGIINSLTTDNDNASIIVRTAGAGHNSLDIKRDYEYLSKLWNKIREATLKSTAPSFIHQEDSIMLKSVRDLLDKHVKEVLVQGPEAYANCIKFVGDMMPTERNIVKEYKSKTPIFTKFRVEEQLTKLYQTNVQLPSGGYIVINPTEALTSIDVNSGRSTQERSIEEMALKTNMEAAREIARQARLRDLSGLLVLDFIDMSSNKNRKIVERTLREYMGKDKARIQMAPISTFGLLELSRQRLKPSFLEVNSIMCSHCSGKGIIRADEANSMLILRTIENEVFNSTYDVVNVYGVASSMIFLLNNKRTEINFVEQKYNIKLNFYIDKDATSDSYSIEKIKLSDNKKKKTTKSLRVPILQGTSDIYAESETTGKSRKKIETKDSRKKNITEHSKDNINSAPSEDKKRKTPRKSKSKKLENSEIVEKTNLEEANPNTDQIKQSQTLDTNNPASENNSSPNTQHASAEKGLEELKKEDQSKKTTRRKRTTHNKKTKKATIDTDQESSSNKQGEESSGNNLQTSQENNLDIKSTQQEEKTDSSLEAENNKATTDKETDSNVSTTPKAPRSSNKRRIAKKAATKTTRKKEKVEDLEDSSDS